MKNLLGRYFFLLILAVPLISLSCSSVTSPNEGLNLIASISQQTAESVTFRIEVENTGLTAKTLQFGSSQFFDIEVRDQIGRLAWCWSDGQVFLAMVWALELSPGESSVQETVWNIAGNDQMPLPHGSYVAKIYITSNPRDEGLSSVIRLTI